ncbi:MAG: transcription termination factor Rho [Eubacteriales bacterium]|nr:transcription termination factor Rho [Eubacteriales bacterium]
MTRERYESISLHDLREIAKNRGMKRISALKKADLIDAMLKKDEEEAILLREEKKKRRQQADPGPGILEAGAEEGAGDRSAGKGRAADLSGTGDEDGSGHRTGTDPAAGAARVEDGPVGSAQERTTAGREDNPAEAARREVSMAAQSGQGAGTGQARQRNQGQNQRGRQSAVTYTGSGRRQPEGRPRRDDRQRTAAGRAQRPQRNVIVQNTQAGAAAFQERAGGRPAERGGSYEQDREWRRDQQVPAQTGAGQGANAGSGLQEEAGSYGRENAAASGSVKPAADQDRDQAAQQASRGGSGYGQAPQEVPQEPQGARLPRYYQPGRPDTPVIHKDELNAELDSGQLANGILEVMQDGFGFIRCANYMPGENDIYVAPSQIRRFGLKTGDIIVGNIRVRTSGEKFSALLYVKSVNGYSPEEATKRYNFENMTPVFPDERIRLERAGGSVSMRIMDLMCPVGKGQRGMIVSPPKAGKTTLIKEVARSVKYNNPEIHLIVLLIDERPEEVTDIREAIEGPGAEVIYSTFDELPEHHKRVSEMAIERARRLVEHRQDVMILLDSITRLTRAYNITEPPSGRTLSGGLDPAALHMPKRFFGAARNMREGGSLTILATALIDTGSKMDDIVFEEFKGTGNMELVLDRRLSERRIFPAIDIVRSGTRREDLLLTPDELSAINTIRRAFNGLSAEQAVTQALDLFSRTRSNGEFVNMVRKIPWGMAPERPQRTTE